MRRSQREFHFSQSAAILCAAFVVFAVGGWWSVARVSAQAPQRIEGQIFNGTASAGPAAVKGVDVTLYQVTASGPVTSSVATDADGRFMFNDVSAEANTFFARTDYGGIRYFSDIVPAPLAATTPLTMTVYETMTMPANFQIDRAHFVFDIAPRSLSGLALLEVTTPNDRAFFMPLPVPEKVTDVAFNDIREQNRIVRADDGTILYPVTPGIGQILYGVTLPTKPPTFDLVLPVPTTIAALNLLVQETGDVQIQGSGLTRGAEFVAPSGAKYLTASTGKLNAGTTLTASISNLPGADNTNTINNIVLTVGGLAAMGLLAYPFWRERGRGKAGQDVSERVVELQAIAALDDAYAAHEIGEEDYRIRREALKAELLSEQVKKTQANEKLIQTLKLEKSFGLKRVLRGITLDIPAGQVVALVGPNGAGKSTLLRILATLSRPTAGRAAINGLAIPEDAMEARTSIGYVGHQTLLYDDLTVAENLRYYGKLYGLDDLDSRTKVVAARVGVERRLDDRVRTLSRGLKQRTALARAILHRPQAYLFDEPYTGLDQKSSVMLNELFAEARTRGASVLFSTHEFERGITDADRALVMRGGRLLYDGMRSEWGNAASFNELYERILERARSERPAPDAGAQA